MSPNRVRRVERSTSFLNLAALGWAGDHGAALRMNSSVVRDQVMSITPPIVARIRRSTESSKLTARIRAHHRQALSNYHLDSSCRAFATASRTAGWHLQPGIPCSGSGQIVQVGHLPLAPRMALAMARMSMSSVISRHYTPLHVHAAQGCFGDSTSTALYQMAGSF